MNKSFETLAKESRKFRNRERLLDMVSVIGLAILGYVFTVFMFSL